MLNWFKWSNLMIQLEMNLMTTVLLHRSYIQPFINNYKFIAVINYLTNMYQIIVFFY